MLTRLREDAATALRRLESAGYVGGRLLEVNSPTRLRSRRTIELVGWRVAGYVYETMHGDERHGVVYLLSDGRLAVSGSPEGDTASVINPANVPISPDARRGGPSLPEIARGVERLSGRDC